MKIYVANRGDTLRQVSVQFGIQLDALCALNPNVEGLDKQLFDQQIRIPELSDQHPLQSILPFCSTPPVPETAEWIPLTPLKKMEETEYDVLIVGTGAGGGAVLRRLAERLNGNGNESASWERGGLMLPTHVNNIATMTDPTSSDYFTRMSVPVNSDTLWVHGLSSHLEEERCSGGWRAHGCQTRFLPRGQYHRRRCRSIIDCRNEL